MEEKEGVAEIRRERDAALEPLVAAGEELVQRLSRLKDDDKATVLALMMVTQALGSYTWSVGRRYPKILGSFLQTLTNLSPALAREVNFLDSFLACRDEMIAYASCVSRCEEDGKSDSECARQCAPQEAAEVACVMRQLDELRHKIPLIIRDPFPPPPPPMG